MAARRIFFFGGGEADGDGEMKDVLGGKGAGLAEMTRLGLPVPPGFTISTDVCRDYYAAGKVMPAGLIDEVRAALRRLEKLAGARLGDTERPLLLSVRSGARASMPGMMDTVLDLGLHDGTVEGLARRAGGDRRFAFDSYRRFCSTFASVVLGVKGEPDPFDALLEAKKAERSARSDVELTAGDLADLVRDFKRVARERAGRPIPDEPLEQLLAAIEAVFRSWENPRAVAYRELHGIPGTWGTAVNVQAMVFGNAGQDSGTGVAFTRDPATGDPGMIGEFLVDAQGEDVVSGARTPSPIAELALRFPALYRQLLDVRATLEARFRDMQDIEFTVERGKLWVLQCRSGKRTGASAVRIAVDLAEEGLITRQEALLRVAPGAIEQVLRPVFDAKDKALALAQGRLLARGLPAGPGAASGVLALTPAEAEARAARGEAVILARRETSPEDIRGMHAARGLLTAFGGMTSHAALVARQLGKVAVVGCGALSFDDRARTMTVGARTLREGDWISIDGTAGEVIEGSVGTSASEVVRALVEKTLDPAGSPICQRLTWLLEWADDVRRLGVRANADQADQAAVAVAFGAEGIGLCRTEHMFFGPGKIGPMREMILARTVEERRAALAKLLPLQRADFAGLLRAMEGLPVTVRTLDPPLHEFLPPDEAAVAETAAATGHDPAWIRKRRAELHEANPMLGHRGCRLGITYPEVTETQARALFEAACDVLAEGLQVHVQVMVPLVGERRELDDQSNVVRRAAEAVFAERGRRVDFKVGTMIEVPRAALTAGEIAHAAQFFSFGTNDLTQMTLGLSRDDIAPVLGEYVARGIYAADPFTTLDRDGVGALMRMAVAAGRAARHDLEIGVCGEHGGDPESIAFCDELGLDYVSCSPYRVPVARLAAAQATLRRPVGA